MEAMQKTSTVTIYEPDHTGHRLKYVALIAEAFFNIGYRVVIVTTVTVLNSMQYKQLLLPYKHRFEIVTVPGTSVSRNMFTAMMRDAFALSKLLRTTKADLLFVPCLDSSFYVFGCLGAVHLLRNRNAPPIHGILFRGNYAYQRPAFKPLMKLKQKATEWIILKGPYSRILCLDEIVYDRLARSLKRKIKAFHNRFILCPDPVESSIGGIDADSFRKMYCIPTKARIVGGFGNIDERKGMDLLIRAFVKYGPSDYEYLLLVGPQNNRVREVLKSIIESDARSKNIVSVDRFVSDDELLAAIDACDVVAAPYPEHIGSASIVLRAAAFNKPVLGSEFGWIGHFVRKYRLGYCCNVLDEKELIIGIHWAFNAARLNSDDAKAFAALNSVERFQQTITQEAK